MGVRYKSNIQDGFFYWSALENDLVSDYITNPIIDVLSARISYGSST